MKCTQCGRLLTLKGTGCACDECAPASSGTVEGVVRRRDRLVIQGLTRFDEEWRDLESGADCDYFRKVMPPRLEEYKVEFAGRYCGFRLIQRTEIDRHYQPNTGADRT